MALYSAGAWRLRGRNRNVLVLLLFVLCLWCCILLTWPANVLVEASEHEGRRLIHLDLHPSSTVDPYVKRRLLETSSGNRTLLSNLPEPKVDKSAGVYASIPDRYDPLHSNDRQLRGFYARRHLSRYEQQYRLANTIDMELNWNGTYTYGDERDGNESIPLRHRRWLAGTSTSTHGGKFDNYQAVPLSQGYGTHFANVWVGSPTPQRKTVIVDTGSHYTAFPCSGCENCGGPHHTDPYFQPSKSKTFHKLQCDECRDGVVCDNGQCKFSQSYTEGSSWEAVQVHDRFYCGGTDILDSVDPDSEKYAIRFMFGCQMSMTGLFITQLADGIMGMSAHPATLPKQLYDRRIIEHNMFAMCFRRELGTSKRGVTAGSMTFGGFSTTLDTSPVVYAKNMASVGWFTVYVKALYVRAGGQSAVAHDDQHQTIQVKINPASLNSGKGVIVDSGTTDTYLNKAVAKEFNKAWRKATGKAYSHSPIRLTNEQLQKLPTILVQCHAYSQKPNPSIDDYDSIPGYAGKLDPSNPNDLLIAIPATSYMDYSPITKMYTSRVYFTETTGGVLGSNAMQGHNVVFDWENGRVGFAESSCSYDKKNIPKAGLDSGFSADCLVGDPVLSQPCVDTVDRRLCKHNPTNIALLGTEIWAATVESAGTSSGSSCVESAKAWQTANVQDEPVITCIGEGACEEHRPCQLKCAEVEKAVKVEPTPLENSRLGCGNSHWSACDYGCKQTKITSVAHSDGLCHEESREVRGCHIGACARSDPCRVPFLLHVVVGLRGGAAELWSYDAEETFVRALTKTARVLAEYPPFEEGDVNVLGVLPWDLEDSNENVWHHDHVSDPGEARTGAYHGLKVVAEISMFNFNVRRTDNDEPVADNEHAENGRLSAMLHNISSRFRLGEARSTCNAEDMRATAKKALRLKKEVFLDSRFPSFLVKELHKTERQKMDGKRSPFSFATTVKESTSQSRVLSAWSIQTEIDDDINYLGPPKPIWFRILAAIHTVVLFVVVFMLLSTAWAVGVAAWESVGDATSTTRLKPTWMVWRSRPKYSAVNVTDDEAEVEDAIMGAGPGSVELTDQSPGMQRYKRTTPKKRRSTLTSPSLSDLSER